MGVAGSGKLFGGGKTDVGAFEGLRHVQSELRPLDACELDFDSRDFGVGQHHDTVNVTPCTPEASAPSVQFVVPPAWKRAHPTVKFFADRSKASEAWHIRVDTSRATFEELQAALEELAPALVRAYPGLLAAYRAVWSHAREDVNRAAAEAAAARERAKQSYPKK